jgi:serine/threonine protein kinase
MCVYVRAFFTTQGFFAPEMITQSQYYGDKADIWSTGCILLELILGHERFCEVWMPAYDYEVLQVMCVFPSVSSSEILHLFSIT